MRLNNPKKFAVLEGIDYAGKTTIAEGLSNYVGSPILSSPPLPFKKIKREILEMAAPLARLCYFLGSNVQISTEVRNRMGSAHVICDRYIWSTIAYHAAMEQMSVESLMPFVEQVRPSLLLPNFVFFLTVRRDVQLLRAKTRSESGIQRDLLMSNDFQNRLSLAYDEARKLIGLVKWVSIDTSELTIQETLSRILETFGV
jgi:thymidylate kinase